MAPKEGRVSNWHNKLDRFELPKPLNMAGYNNHISELTYGTMIPVEIRGGDHRCVSYVKVNAIVVNDMCDPVGKTGVLFGLDWL